MRYIYLVPVLAILSCGERNEVARKDLLKDWILLHEKELIIQTDSITHDYRSGQPGPNWKTADIAITNSMSGPLGQLADKAGDSTNCIVVMLTVFENKKFKPRIILEATDSSCLKKLKTIELVTDSTQNIVFGKSEESLQ